MKRKRKIILIICLCLNTLYVNSNNLLDSVYCAMYQVLKYNYENLEAREQENVPCREYLYIADMSDTITVSLEHHTNFEETEVDEDFEETEVDEETEGVIRRRYFADFYTDINLEREFSMYMFEYPGFGHDYSFILIKVYDEFLIYNMRDINRIIRRLSYIKMKHPDIVTDSIFINCIDEIIKMVTYRDLEVFKPLGNNIYYCVPDNMVSKVGAAPVKD